jgi:hypothetical protein
MAEKMTILGGKTKIYYDYKKKNLKNYSQKIKAYKTAANNFYI